MNTKLRVGLITLATILTVSVTSSLGLWQLSRAAEKQARQAAMDHQSTLPPLTAASLLGGGDGLTLLHRQAVLRGRWAATPPIFLENRPMDGRAGFLVMSPLVLVDGRSAIAVQRGWVPRRLDDRTQVPVVDTPGGVVEVEGRMAIPPSDLLALGPPTSGSIRQNLDLRQWGDETGLTLMPLTLQQSGPPDAHLVRHWPVVNLGVEKNLGYAVQWFAMAAVCGGLFIWFQVIRRFKNRPKDPQNHVQ